MPNLVTRGKIRAGGVVLGAAGTASLNPASINGDTKGSVTFTLTGAAVGDLVLMAPPAALEAGLSFVGAAVTSANTVTVYLTNHTGAPVDGAALTWSYALIQRA